MKGWGIALMMLGLAMLGFGAFMETTVGSINNLGLMADRLIFVPVGGFAFLSGAVMNVGAQVLDAIKPPEPSAQEPGKIDAGYKG